jgi:hypothetical protein
MEILEKILNDRLNRKNLIKQFQEYVWHHEVLQNKTLSELAYDLDFYEPDAMLRAQDPSYYGDERLEVEIKTALQKLKTNTT